MMLLRFTLRRSLLALVPSLVVALGLAAGQALAADELVLIAHPGLSLSLAETRDVFLGDKQFAGQIRLVPVDNASAHEIFLRDFLHMEPNRYGLVWTRKAFRDGITAPAVKGGDAEVLEFVRRTPGAVGYLRGPAAAGVIVVR